MRGVRRESLPYNSAEQTAKCPYLPAPPLPPPLSNKISTVFGPQCLSSNTGGGFGRGGGGGGSGWGRISI